MKQAIGIILGVAAVVGVALFFLRRHTANTQAEIREDFVCGEE